MDDMHGFEVLRSLRADPELTRTVVVMISAKSYKPDIDRAKEMGADDYVVKPFYPDELVSRVERLRADRAAPAARRRRSGAPEDRSRPRDPPRRSTGATRRASSSGPGRTS